MPLLLFRSASLFIDTAGQKKTRIMKIILHLLDFFCFSPYNRQNWKRLFRAERIERMGQMAKRILLVDDEPLILKGLRYTLEQEGYETETAEDGEDALEKFFNDKFDLVLLDVMLPKLDGIAVCQRMREQSSVPIIMLTAKGEDMDKILGLEYGADDYMTKPFNILEVKARIKTILRRANVNPPHEGKRMLRVHDMEVNIVNRTVTLGSEDVKLTAKEFDLLQLFMNNRGKVFSREAMLETVWKYDYTGDARTVDVHIRRLREKIERFPSQPEFIFTKWGVGYYFTDRD